MNRLPPLHRPSRPPRRARQRGATLLVVVALLLGMGLMSLTGFYLSRGQYQLVGNLQHSQQAFTRAEATAAVAEQWLASSGNAQSAGFTSYDTALKGLYPEGQLAALGRDPATMAWGDANSIATPEGRYLIEQLSRGVKLPGASVQIGQRSTGSCKSVDLFRVVTNSDSTRGASRMIETLFATDGCY